MKLRILYHGSAGLLVVTIAALAASTSFAAEIPTVGTRFDFTVQVKPTAVAQLRYAESLIAATRGARDHQPALEAIASLSVIPVKWPDATAEVLHSYILTADVANRFNMTSKALEVLTAALPLSEQTEHHVGVLRRLGETHLSLGMLAEAEDALLRAESSRMFRRASEVEQYEALRRLAIFYSQQNRPEQAIPRLKSAAQLRGPVTPIHSAVLRVAAVKEAAKLNGKDGRANARAELAEVQSIVAHVRSRMLTPAEMSDLNGIEDDLKRLEALLASD